MKKLLMLAAIFSLVFAGCKEEETEPDYSEIGKKGPGGGTIFFAGSRSSLSFNPECRITPRH
jgi:hypothetical protein